MQGTYSFISENPLVPVSGPEYHWSTISACNYPMLYAKI